MPTSGPVYQPTTVSYEQQNEWSRPGSYLSQTVSSSFRSPRCMQWFLLALGMFSLGAGVIMIIEGTIEFSDNVQTQLVDKNGDTKQRDTSTSELVITIIGALLVILGVLMLGVYYVKLVRRRNECPCFPDKEERLAMQLDNQAGNGQYGPVSEIAYQPPTANEHEETSKLMANDLKDSNEESERMLESDPRIVLRPLSHGEEA
ncbi:uncharacterized protein [Halyomorpha halys]|uniref:uncharacterized protein isoform X2 n=1 Tax=Halyomorpha halys TaxID=286706 RepID=UPI0006D4F788|nr:uncharacterized protein LOC106691809 isoform X2 [Halyomorpha halys]